VSKEKTRESGKLSGSGVGLTISINQTESQHAKHSTPKALSVITMCDGLCRYLIASLRQS